VTRPTPSASAPTPGSSRSTTTSEERLQLPTIRAARAADAAAIAAIFEQGIAERQATFETRATPPQEFARRIEAGEMLLVAERDGEVVAWAGLGPYSDPHDYYAGVGEATMYVALGARRSGVGRTLLNALAEEAERRGYWKLVGKIFTSNRPSIELVRGCGFREVGVHRRHGRLDGEWKDVLVVERLLLPAL
jgi:L-amino acid N-acyltransferase YncA